MAITFDASIGSFATTFSSTRTFSHTVGAGTNRVLIVSVGHNGVTSSRTISGVTYNAIAMTQFRRRTNSDIASELWYLVNPSTGANNVIVTMGGGTGVIGAIAHSYQGVDQTTPMSAGNDAVASSTAPSVNISAATGNMVVDSVVGFGSVTLTAGAGQTDMGNGDATASTTHIRCAASREAGAATTTMSWTQAPSAVWVITGGKLNPDVPLVSNPIRMIV